MTRKFAKRLVIDASVAHAAGGPDAVHPTSKACHDFLTAVSSISYQMVTTPEIAREWLIHMSEFAGEWFAQMQSRKKLVPIRPTARDKLLRAVEVSGQSQLNKKAMTKDLLLLDAALASDRRIASLDEKARWAFSLLAAGVARIRTVVWVNPACSDDKPVDWLRKGARPAKARMLQSPGRSRRG